MSAAHVPAYEAPKSGFVTRLQVLSTRIPSIWVAPFCGATAGVASGIVTCPLDVIKTKLQAQGGFARRVAQQDTATLYKGMLGTGKTIFRHDGIRGLYQGLGPMLLGISPTWAVYLAVYDGSREYYEKTWTDNFWLSRGLASITAGACSTVVTNPIWVIKTRLMSQSLKQNNEGFRAPWQYKNTWDAARKMYQIEGFRSFYSGLTPALLGLTHVAIQFPLYEYLKMAFTGYGIGEHPDTGSSHWIGISCSPYSIANATTDASSFITGRNLIPRCRQTSPRQQSPLWASSSDGMHGRPRYHGVIRTCQTIWREEGGRAFYSGIGTNLFRAIPAAMTTMLTYEYLRKLIHTLQHEGEMHLAMQKENAKFT
ncbi:hypothetical protein N7470_002884 [Penicillium chermesinum]|nr:hypothetical protein N7470_002884 [Penicillium chermesinum]